MHPGHREEQEHELPEEFPDELEEHQEEIKTVEIYNIFIYSKITKMYTENLLLDAISALDMKPTDDNKISKFDI